jgi:hypothetical protein
MNNDERLNPSIFHTRYVPLTHLRDATLAKIRELTTTKKNLLLVDFGCGNMPYRPVIEPMVGKYLGVDLEMNPKAEYHINFDSKTTLPDNYADIILSNQVLEHVDPTPNDYWRWTSAGLRRTIEAEGFKITSFFGIMGLAASGLQLFQDGICLKLPKFLVPPFALVMQALIALFNKINSQAQRDRDAALYVVVAQKPL